MEKLKTCFIENDLFIDIDDREYMLDRIRSAVDRQDIAFDPLFDTIVTEAAQRPKDAWEAILEADYIFIKTAFIGDSARLLENLCEMALYKKITDKTIVNFRNSDSMLYLSNRGLRLFKTLQDRNNVRYVSQDTDEFVEICKQLTA